MINTLPVFLIGYMGAGKTTTGKLLSSKLGYKFIDLDELIETRTGLAIPVIFELKGEEYFRTIEKEALRTLAGAGHTIIATGGGCAVYDDNMEWMQANGITVYLRCHPGKIFHRIAPQKQKRPLLAGLDDVDIMEFIIESIKTRLPFYVKSHTNVNGETEAEQVASEIAERVNRFTTSSSPG